MLVRDAFQILEIEKTDDKRAIKTAYRKLLPLYNPEENEEKFLMLRDAYDTAMKYAQNKVEEELPEREEHPEEEEVPKREEHPEEEEVEIGELSFLWQDEKEEAELSKEERTIQEILTGIESLYEDNAQRNNMEKWAILLENDIFLSLDYGQRAKQKIMKCLSDKYLLKTSVLKLVFERLELYDREINLWEWTSKEYMLFFMSKIRDISDYTDFLYDYIRCSDIPAACQELQEYLMGSEESVRENPANRVAELFGTGEEEKLLYQIEQMIERYPCSIFWRLWAMDVCAASDMGEKEERITQWDKEILSIFLENYIKDSRFLHWQSEYEDSMYVYPEEQSVLAFSKFGEFLLALGYIMRNTEKAELLEEREDRLLLLSYLYIRSARQTERRDQALWFLRKAESAACEVITKRPKDKSGLYLRMVIATELYDFETTEECYIRALEIMPDNVGIYIYMAKAYDFVDRRKESGYIFDEAKKNGAEDYRLQLRYLRFREQFDFVDGYNLEEPLAICHQLLDEMNYYAVTGELLADAYYTMGRLILADARYDNAGQYLSIALKMRRKTEYLFLAALDCMVKSKDLKTAGDLLEEVYQSREIWGDSESNNPMFAEHGDRDITPFMDICWETGLYNLCIKLGWCNELMGRRDGDAQAYRNAAGYYKEALTIKPDTKKLGSAIARVMEWLLEGGSMTFSEAEEYWEGLNEENKSWYSMQWLKALIAYKKGDEESAVVIATGVAKVKDEKSFEVDWIHFSQYLLAKIYWKQKREQFALKYIRAALEGFGVARRSSIPDNRYLIRQICVDAAEWFTELGLEKEAKVVTQDLKRFK